MRLLEYTSIKDHAIELEWGKQPSHGPIYSLGLVKFEILKTYIKTHLKTGFIRLLQFPVGASIFFDQKQDGTLRVCYNYRGLDNQTIKNRYSLLLIDETLN